MDVSLRYTLIYNGNYRTLTINSEDTLKHTNKHITPVANHNSNCHAEISPAYENKSGIIAHNSNSSAINKQTLKHDQDGALIIQILMMILHANMKRLT